MHSDNVSTTASPTRDRKTTKPIMEKRRRARINASLSELKSLLLEAIKKEGARQSKMEKADILEMTVKHLRQMQRQHFTVAVAEDPTVLDKYRHGFNECAIEVKRYLTSLDSCDTEVKTRLLSHIANCVTGLDDADTSSRCGMTSPVPTLPSPVKSEEIGLARPRPTPNEPAPTSPVSVDLNNNVSTMTSLEQVKTGNVFGGLQVIPTQLPSGEIAFVLPTNILKPSQVPNYVIPVYAGAPSVSTTTHPLVVSSSATHVSPSLASQQSNCSQRSNVASSNCDKSYLPCATVTPVKPVSNHLQLESLFVNVKQSGSDVNICGSRRQDTDASREEAVWRPW